MNVSWTKEDLEFLRAHYKLLKDEDIAAALNKTKEGVRKKRQRIGLSKEENRGKS